MDNFQFFVLVILFAIPATVLSDDDHPMTRSIISNLKASADEYRLPNTFMPLSYDITLEPHFNNFTFSGKVIITMTAKENDLEEIVLHSNNLVISKISIRTPTEPTNITNTSSFDEERHFLAITTKRKIKIDEWILLEIDYIGQLNERSEGFYRASYKTYSGEERWLATTQFEPTFAREAFPCFDEPHMKASFKIQIITDKARRAISNSREQVPKSLSENRVLYEFEKTVKMSTYLVAFVVSDFDFKATDSHEVYARKDMIDNNRQEYALSLSHATMKAMENFTNIPYGLNKITQIGIPDNWFVYGAMENWGLVTYKERYLLYKKGVNTAAEKQRIGVIIAHEYAHQWFGNLVSPSWWNYIWLNEGFATYFEYYAADKVSPEWRLMEQFVILTVQYALGLDAQENTRPITYNATTPEEISALFDVIAYDKAGSVLRMMEHFVSHNNFQNGLRSYLKKKEYGVATEDDLWSEKFGLTLPIGLSLSKIMKTWTSNRGYPVVNVTRNEDGNVKLTQNRFFLSQNIPGDNTLWYIPINYATEDKVDFHDTTAKFWLTKKDDLIRNLKLDAGKWIIVNKNQTGYYRVNYDEVLWGQIIKVLNSNNTEIIPATNRAQLLDDAFNLAIAGQLNYTILFDLLNYVKNETDFIPLFSFSKGIENLNKLVRSLDNYEQFKTFVKNSFAKIHEKLGTTVSEKDGHIDRLTRSIVLKWMCEFGDSDCIKAMKELVQGSELHYIDPDLQAVAYCAGVSDGKEEDFDILKVVYGRAEDLEKERIINGMACMKDKYLLYVFFSWAPKKIPALIAAAKSSETGLEAALDFIEHNYLTYNFTASEIRSVVTEIGSRLTNESLIEEMIKFLDSLKGSTYESVIEPAKISLEEAKLWRDKNSDLVRTWLTRHYSEESGEGGASTFHTSFFVLLLSVLALIILK